MFLLALVKHVYPQDNSLKALFRYTIPLHRTKHIFVKDLLLSALLDIYVVEENDDPK